MLILGFTFVNNERIQQGAIMEILLILSIGLLLYSLFGKNKKAVYSWDKKSGGKKLPIILTIFLLISLGIYIAISLFFGSVLTI